MPGVSLHAQAIEQILQGSFLQRPDFATPAELLYILVLGTLIAFLIYRLGAAGSAVLGGLAVAGVIGVSWYAFDASAGWSIRSTRPSRSPRSISPARCSSFYGPSASGTGCVTLSPITWRPLWSSDWPTIRRG